MCLSQKDTQIISLSIKIHQSVKCDCELKTKSNTFYFLRIKIFVSFASDICSFCVIANVNIYPLLTQVIRSPQIYHHAVGGSASSMSEVSLVLEEWTAPALSKCHTPVGLVLIMIAFVPSVVWMHLWFWVLCFLSTEKRWTTTNSWE